MAASGVRFFGVEVIRVDRCVVPGPHGDVVAVLRAQPVPQVQERRPVALDRIVQAGQEPVLTGGDERQVRHGLVDAGGLQLYFRAAFAVRRRTRSTTGTEMRGCLRSAGGVPLAWVYGAGRFRASRRQEVAACRDVTVAGWSRPSTRARSLAGLV